MKGVKDWLNKPNAKPKQKVTFNEEPKPQRNLPVLLPADLPDFSPHMGRLYQSAVKAAQGWFQEANDDGNEFIDKSEFDILWQKLTGTKLSSDQLGELFGKITKGDKISYKDVCIWRVNTIKSMVDITKLPGY